MKILTKDFNPIPWLKGWKTLSVQTRSKFIKSIDSVLKVSPTVFTPEQVDELAAAGFLLPNRSVLVADIRPFRTLVRSMYRHRKIFSSAAGPDYEYVLDHLQTEECADIARRRGRYYASRTAHDVIEIISSSPWTRKFLESATAAEWEQGADFDEAQQMHPESFELLKHWIRDAVEGENPVDLLAVLTKLKRAEPLAQAALRAGVRDMLWYLSLHPQTLDVVSGILPAVRSELNRASVKMPESCPPPVAEKIFEFPITYYDIRVLLEQSRGEGVQVKADGQLFKKELTRISEQLIAVPETGNRFSAPDEVRVAIAQNWIVCMGFAKIPRRAKQKSSFLKITPKGEDWLALSAEEQHQSLVDLIRAHRNDSEPRIWGAPYVPFLPFSPMNHYSRGHIVETAVVQAFASIPENTWLKLHEFLEWQAESVNPFISRIEGVCDQPLPFWSESLEQKRSGWIETLNAFFFSRLLVLGGGRLGPSADNVPVISLTPIGRYLIGERDDFVCKAAVNTGGVIVQPNFEIVFTAVNAVAECEIMRYAERIGKQVGVLFKITRDSILQSLDSAMTGAEVIESLQLCSGVQVPKNVVTQITDWCCSYRVVKLEKIHVINCPDAETALRVQSLFPKNAERINDTLVRVESDKSFSSLKSKLKSNGIGLVD